MIVLVLITLQKKVDVSELVPRHFRALFQIIKAASEWSDHKPSSASLIQNNNYTNCFLFVIQIYFLFIITQRERVA